jgi:hypothetical protein
MNLVLKHIEEVMGDFRRCSDTPPVIQNSSYEYKKECNA